MFSYFTHTSILLVLVIVTKIKIINTQDNVENGRDKVGFRASFDSSTKRTPLKLLCNGLSGEMDRIKSALTDMGLMSEMYCSSNSPVKTSRAELNGRLDGDQQNEDTGTNFENKPPENPIYNQEPYGHREMNYPPNYNQPWINYPNVYQYESAHPPPGYYYPNQPPLMQVQPMTPLSLIPPPQPLLPGYPPIITENVSKNIGDSETQETPPDTSEKPVENSTKKTKKSGQRCSSKKKLSRRAEQDGSNENLDENFDISNNTNVQK